MLSGQTPPISANFSSNSPFIIEDDENFQLDISFESEKLLDEQCQQETRTKWNQTKPNPNNISNTATIQKPTTIAVARNFSITNANQLSQSTTLTTPPITTTTTQKINQHQTQSTFEGASNSNPQVSVTPSTGATPKTITGVTNTKQPSNDASGRSAALERAYVHDVYENCEEPTGTIRPRVAQFLAGLDPGSIVCDVGCGNGRYLTSCNPLICSIGADRCHRLTNVAKEKGGEVALCDNLELPFRDESFDAVLSLAVVHHFATTERRVGAIRELARILRIGGRVVITVWALEQRHRRFESQDVLIPWQPPKNRNITYSDEEDDDDFLPPYHAYTEDSTNSSRSAGDGDSSSLSSSSPGESCYSFVRRAIQKLAGGRRHPWFLDSWNSKDTKNDSSLDYEDAKDLPIELRRLEDFEDFPDPPLSAGLKSRSLGSILNPPPRQIVRSRSSVPSLGAQMSEQRQQPAFITAQQQSQQQQSASYLTGSSGHHNPSFAGNDLNNLNGNNGNLLSTTMASNMSTTAPAVTTSSTTTTNVSGSSDRRPKLIKQKQSLCDDDYQLTDNPFHMISSNSYNSSNSLNNSYSKNSNYLINGHSTSNKLRKQSSLNEELMAANRLREKERVRKRIQKQMSLNEAFLCRSMFSKRLQIIREGFTSKLKTSTGSLERVTKNSIVKIMKNFKPSQFSTTTGDTTATTNSTTFTSSMSRDHPLYKQNSISHKPSCPFYVCGNNTSNNCPSTPTAISAPTGTTTNNPLSGVNCNCNNFNSNLSNVNEDQQQDAKLRRHSRESGSDSSKDSSLQSDTSIESEDSFASVIFIPKPEQQQQQKIYQQHNNSNSSSSNSSNGTNSNYSHCVSNHSKNRIPSVPTSPLIMPCPPTPAHSPAAANSTITSPPQAMAAVTAAMSIFSPQKIFNHNNNNSNVNNNINSHTFNNANSFNHNMNYTPNGYMQGVISRNRFTFDEEHIIEQQKENSDGNDAKLTVKQPTPTVPSSMGAVQKQPNYGICNQQQLTSAVPKKQMKITRQLIKDLPQIPKFRRPQSKNSYPIIRRTSAGQTIPRLMSLELFNPATDDLDSDSSEPSSPDSIDSVINALKPCGGDSDDDTKETILDNSDSPTALVNCNNTSTDVKESDDSDKTMTKIQQQKNCFHSMDDQKTKLKLSSTTLVQQHSLDLKMNHNQIQENVENIDVKITNGDMIFINEVENENDFTCNKDSVDQQDESNSTIMSKISKNSHRDCADFAEQLNAQLLREIDDNIRTEKIECRNLDGIGDIGEFIDDPFSKKRSNGDYKDLTALREELRERRLMLANLSTQHSQQQSPTSSSTSSLSSQTRSFTIHEEDEEEEEADGDGDADANSNSSYSLNLYDSCKISKFKYKRNRHYNLNPETAYLLQDDCDSSVRDDDDDDIEHDVILEEDEDEVETDDREIPVGHTGEYCRKTSRNTIKCNEESMESSQTTATNSKTNKTDNSIRPIENRQSTESWEHSNSSTSLDSPSQGGATTHHRYYHVFREGELDALINHHVTSLHIVSSYYERASWCVVAEKVQVWTI